MVATGAAQVVAKVVVDLGSVVVLGGVGARAAKAVA